MALLYDRRIEGKRNGMAELILVGKDVKHKYKIVFDWELRAAIPATHRDGVLITH
jgi:hypothetical protein